MGDANLQCSIKVKEKKRRRREFLLDTNVEILFLWLYYIDIPRYVTYRNNIQKSYIFNKL